MGRRLGAVLGWLLLIGIVAALIVGTGWRPSPAAPPSSPETGPSVGSSVPPPVTPTAAANALVSWIADGDTLDATFEGRTTRVRLLNIDAPELGHDGAKDQCLAVAARALVERLAPRGAAVRIVPYGRDRFGRLLAGVYLADGRLLNAEIVRAGLAAPIVVESNVRLLGPVREAQADADAAGVGLHADTGCTIPGRIRSAMSALRALPGKPSAKDAPAALATARSVHQRLTAVVAELTADQRDALVQGLVKERRQALLIQARALLAEATVRIAALKRRL